MHKKLFTYPLMGLLCCTFFYSCSSKSEADHQDQKPVASIEEAADVPQPPLFSSDNLDVKTFEVKDTTSGKSLGWGYDLYVDGHLTIHQPILPGVSGNVSFSSEEEAKKTGAFAISKMKKTGGLPTITIQELDSLGIIIKKIKHD